MLVFCDVILLPFDMLTDWNVVRISALALRSYCRLCTGIETIESDETARDSSSARCLAILVVPGIFEIFVRGSYQNHFHFSLHSGTSISFLGIFTRCTLHEYISIYRA